MIKKNLLTVIFVLLATVAWGEYYQYTDENGNLRFTDDAYQIPATQRSDVEKYESEINESDQISTSRYSAGDEDINTDVPAADDFGSNIDYVGEETLQDSATELNKMQQELNKNRISLEKEQAALETQSPGEDAASMEWIEYSAKVDRLNAKIEKYSTELKTFEEKVESFNQRNQDGAE